MTTRAAIYCRVSTDEQAEHGHSITSQLEAARRYAEAHNLTITHEFREAYSGLKLSRPELDQVRRLMAQGEIDALIVYESSRLTRSKAHGPLLRDELADAGIALHFVTRGKHENTLEAELLASTEDTFNCYWWAKMQEALQRGRKGKAQAGIFVGHGRTPYGYAKIGHKKETRLEIDPVEADVVRLIYQLYVEDEIGMALIANRLTERRIPTPGKQRTAVRTRPAGEWNLEAVRTILRNEVYAGTFYANRYRKSTTATNGSVLRPRGEWIPIPVPAIVDRGAWERVQARIDGAKRYARQAKYEYLMAKRLRCSCGYAARANSAQGRAKLYRYYECYQRHGLTQNTCVQCKFNAELVDAEVWSWVVTLLQDPVSLLSGFREAQEKLDTEHTEVRSQIERVDAQIERHTDKVSQLVDLFLDGGLPRSLLDQKRSDIEETIQALTSERTVLADRLATETITDDHIRSVTEFAADVQEELHLADFALRRQIVEDLNLTGTLAVEDDRHVLYLHWYRRTERVWQDTETSTKLLMPTMSTPAAHSSG